MTMNIIKYILPISSISMVAILLISLQGCTNRELVKTNPIADTTTSDTVLTHPDHIIFVWMEIKGFNSIIGNKEARYINSLVAKGSLFTNSYAITHPSYPN